MEILTQTSKYPTEVALILGFFDGIHLGHKAVIKQAVDYAKENNTASVLVTFKTSPKEYFIKSSEYIFERKDTYCLIEKLGVDYLLELDFASVVNLSPEEYLENILLKSFKPISITTGFNHTFGKDKKGTVDYLNINAEKFGYKYFCIEPVRKEEEIVSTTLIKNYLKQGLVYKANDLLTTNFKLVSTVIKGDAIGRTIDFPTANLSYPHGIVKLPYGVYQVLANGKSAVLNWGVKPTLNGKEPVLEVHIINYSEDLYGKMLVIEFIKRIRDEKKFLSIRELQEQIKKDVEECLR